MSLFKRKPAEPAEPVAETPATETPVTETPVKASFSDLILAEMALRASDVIVSRAVERFLLRGQSAEAGKVIRERTLPETVIGTELFRLSRRSVPAAILIGGTLLLKSLSERRKR